MLLAGEEAGVWRGRVAREGERKSNLHRRAIGTLAVAFEVIQIEVADTAAAKLLSVFRPAALQGEHRQALPLFEKIAVEGAK